MNIEVGLLRQIMRKHGLWQSIQSDVTMLKERDDVGHALTTEEEGILIGECAKSRSRLLTPFILTLLETGSRYGTVRRLQWKNVDVANRCLTFGKDKTRYGSGRTVPLSQRAVEVLKFWAERFPERHPEHFVFPTERVGGSGSDETFGFVVGAVYETDPTRPVGDIKTAWGVARKRAGLPHLRIHDLRHSAVSRMIAARTPLPIISKIVGWSPGTMAKMAARYGHFSVEEMRSAVDSISGSASGSPRFSPQLSTADKAQIQ